MNMYMKRLIVISVIFALVMGTAFAVDVGGTVTGSVNVLEGDNVKDSKITSSAAMNRIRLEGSGENEDGTFGGWIRAEAGSIDFSFGGDGEEGEGGEGEKEDPFISLGGGFAGYAWWKPIDQLKMWIGSNGGDGFFGKDGYSRWMFYQTVGDTAVANPGNAWGGPPAQGYTFSGAFFGGNGGNAFRATISPAEIVDINLEIPFFNGGEVGDVLGDLVAQLDLKLDFGNIAVTYTGDSSDATNGKAYVFFGLGAVENLDLAIGIGLTLPEDEEGQPIYAGIAAKYQVNDAFGLKARFLFGGAGEDKETGIVFDILPYYAFNDSVTGFFSAGVTMTAPDGDDAVIGFHINPYVQVGSEWGPKFLAGLKVWTDGSTGGGDKGDDTKIQWSVPIAISVGF